MADPDSPAIGHICVRWRMMSHSICVDSAWYRALTLTERLAALRRTPASAGEGTIDARAERRLERWQAPFASGSRFDERLAIDATTPDELRQILGESDAALQARSAAPPGWLDDLVRAFRQPAANTLVFRE